MRIILSFLSLLALLSSSTSFAKLENFKALPNLKLDGDNGGRLDSSAWSLSESLAKKKVTVIFYVDPDVKDRNEGISQHLSKRNFSKDKVQYIAIINMAATWLPNFAIASSLKKKQRKYPNTLYLKDLKKLGVSTWKVRDDENNIIVLNSEGRVIYSHFGEVPQSQFEQLINLIEKELI